MKVASGDISFHGQPGRVGNESSDRGCSCLAAAQSAAAPSSARAKKPPATLALAWNANAVAAVRAVSVIDPPGTAARPTPAWRALTPSTPTSSGGRSPRSATPVSTAIRRRPPIRPGRCRSRHPNHPEYPSQRGCVTSALAQVLANAPGASRINANHPGRKRHAKTEKTAASARVQHGAVSQHWSFTLPRRPTCPSYGR